jgi:hypothetical protein
VDEGVGKWRELRDESSVWRMKRSPLDAAQWRGVCPFCLFRTNADAPVSSQTIHIHTIVS